MPVSPGSVGPVTANAPADAQDGNDGGSRTGADHEVAPASTRVALLPRPGRGERPHLDGGQLLQRALCGYSINPYRRCDIRCGYCINAAQGSSDLVVPAGRVAEQVRRELVGVPAGATIGIGTVVDAYPNAEVGWGITRVVLATVVDLDRLFIVVTKSTLVRRDLDLLLASGHGRVCVSLSTSDRRAAERIEPGAPEPAERLALVHELAAAGLDVSVSIAPWIPGLTDVRALLAGIDPAVPVGIGPLNTTWFGATSAHLARGRTQAEIDAAYLAEVERVGTPANVGWLPEASSATDDVYRTVSAGPVWTEHTRHWFREAVRRDQAASSVAAGPGRTS